ELETAQPLERVAPPCAVVHALAHGLAELAVARDVDARRMLAAHDVADRRGQARLIRVLVRGFLELARAVELDAVVRAGQAPRVRGQDPRATVPHGGSPAYSVRLGKARAPPPARSADEGFDVPGAGDGLDGEIRRQGARMNHAAAERAGTLRGVEARLEQR